MTCEAGETHRPGYKEGSLQLVLLPLAVRFWIGQRGCFYTALSKYVHIYSVINFFFPISFLGIESNTTGKIFRVPGTANIPL